MQTTIAPKIIDMFSKQINQYNKNVSQTFSNICTNNAASVMVAKHYKPLGIDKNNYNVCNFAPHRDAGTFALLSHQLQLQHSRSSKHGILETFVKDKWYRIDPKPNCMILIVGRTLEYWSNGYFHAPLHRVRNISNQARNSLVFFNNCNNNENAKFEFYLPIKNNKNYKNYNNCDSIINEFEMKQKRLQWLNKKYNDMQWYDPKSNLLAIEVMAILMQLIPIPKQTKQQRKPVIASKL